MLVTIEELTAPYSAPHILTNLCGFLWTLNPKNGCTDIMAVCVTKILQNILYCLLNLCGGLLGKEFLVGVQYEVDY